MQAVNVRLKLLIRLEGAEAARAPSQSSSY